MRWKPRAGHGAGARATRAWRGVGALLACASVLACVVGAAEGAACTTATGTLASVTQSDALDDYATANELALAYDAPYIAPSSEIFPRCFSRYVFTSDDDGTLEREWMVVEYPMSSTLNATSTAFGSFEWTTTSEVILRPDLEGNYSVALVDALGCYASDVKRIEALWTCEPTGTNATFAALFVVFGAACAFWFARELPSSDPNDENQVYLDVVAAFGMKNRAGDRMEESKEYETEMRQLVAQIKSEHLLYITKLDLSVDLKNMALDKTKARRESQAQNDGVWNAEEQTFQKYLSSKERRDHFFSSAKERAWNSILKAIAGVRHKWKLNSSVFSLWFEHRLSLMLRKEYICVMFLRVQLRLEFLLLCAFAWRRFGYAMEMYRDSFIDTLFTPYLFGSDLTDAQAALSLTIWFVVILFGVVICPILGIAFGRLSSYFEEKMQECAEVMESGGDKSMADYLEGGDEEGGDVDADDDSRAPGLISRVLSIFKRKSNKEVYDPVRDLEKQRKKIISEAAWVSASDEAIIHALHSETSAPINLRLIPRGAAKRMEVFANRALAYRHYSRFSCTSKERAENIGFILRVLTLRIGFVPMIFTSLGFLTVADSFVQTPWVHVTKNASAAAGANLFTPLCVGLGAIVVSMKTSIETESLSPYLRSLPFFDIVSTFLKLVVATVAAVVEGEFGGQGVPALNAQSGITSLNTFREFALILVCFALLVMHFKMQTVRGFGNRWNSRRTSNYASAFLFAICAYSSRSFNQPPWTSHVAPVLTVSENFSRPSVVIAIVVAVLANIAGRALNTSREDVCINDEVRKLRDPKYADEEDEILSPEFINEQIESESVRDRVVTLIAFNELLNEQQQDKLIWKLVRQTQHPRTAEGMEEAWQTSSDAFEELGVIVHCIMEDPDQEFLQRAGESLIRDILQAYIDATLEMTLWCHQTSDDVVWGAVKRIVSIITDCIKEGETKAFHAAIASVAMESVQSPEYAALLSTILFNAHDIDLDKDEDGNVQVSLMNWRKIVDDAYDIKPPPVAMKHIEPVTHVRDPNTGDVRRLDKLERVSFAAKAWLRKTLAPEDAPKLSWFATFGYYASVKSAQSEADKERIEIAQDFMRTLLKASVSPDQQIAFFSIRTLLIIVRAGYVTSTILAVDGLNDLFACLNANSGKSTATFIAEIIQTVMGDKNSRSELLISLSNRLIALDQDDELSKLHCIELIHQAIKLEMSAVYRCRQLSIEDDYKTYQAAMSPEAAQCAHDALYGALIDVLPNVRDNAIPVLVDLITLYVWGSRTDHYVFTPCKCEEYADQTYLAFVSRQERMLPGGVLMANAVHRRTTTAREDESQDDAEKLIAVLLKVYSTDSDATVRDHAQQAVADVKALLSSTVAEKAVTLFNKDAKDRKVSAPSSKTLRDVTQMVQASVQRQHLKDGTASKIRLNEFWRKMKERTREQESGATQSQSTRGGIIEINRDFEARSKPRVPPGGKVPLTRETTGFKQTGERTMRIVRHPQPTAELERLRRLRLQRSEKSAEKRVRREVASERWYGGGDFKRPQSDTQTVDRPTDSLNARPTYTPRSWGMTKLPKEMRAPPRQELSRDDVNYKL